MIVRLVMHTSEKVYFKTYESEYLNPDKIGIQM